MLLLLLLLLELVKVVPFQFLKNLSVVCDKESWLISSPFPRPIKNMLTTEPVRKVESARPCWRGRQGPSCGRLGWRGTPPPLMWMSPSLPSGVFHGLFYFLVGTRSWWPPPSCSNDNLLHRHASHGAGNPVQLHHQLLPVQRHWRARRDHSERTSCGIKPWW